MAILGAQVMGGEAYIQFKPELIDANGDIAVDSTREFLRRYMENFARLVRRWHSGA
jgi:chromate reductase, NAD(P)H dehydrogenase (quinone)